MPGTATIPGQVSAQLSPPRNPWRAASSTWVTGLTWAIDFSQPCSSAIGA